LRLFCLIKITFFKIKKNSLFGYIYIKAIFCYKIG
jgi:hypothetical protein